MACSVLRCEQPVTNVIELSDLGIGAPERRHEVVLCAEHHYRLTDGERCSWIDEDRVLVVGADLDSGGQLIPVGWKLQSAFGRTEVSIDVETPSGEDAEPVKFLVSADERNKWVDFLMSLDMDTPLFGLPEDP